MTPLNRCLCCVDCYLPVNDFSVIRGQFPGASQIRNACFKEIWQVIDSEYGMGHTCTFFILELYSDQNS